MPVTLVLGGARSGKSSYAQRTAEAGVSSHGRLVMVATAQAHDAEMADRIARHKADRGARWITLEAPVLLPETIAKLLPSDAAVVDCLTLWVNNLLMAHADIESHAQNLLSALAKHHGSIWLVSNEVGWGIVPDNELARTFRDVCGRLHQQIASQADRVVLVVAGLPLPLK
jgi:adenosylcobinamide kinase/adenosylcobinamide-phosphate guanylyltransferase